MITAEPNSPLADARFGAIALGQQQTYGSGLRPHPNARLCLALRISATDAG